MPYEAIQFKNGNFAEIEEFVGGDAEFRERHLVVATLDGALTARPNDWIVKDPSGKFLAVPPDLFNRYYERLA